MAIPAYVISLESPVKVCEQLAVQGLSGQWIQGIIATDEQVLNETHWSCLAPKSAIGIALAHIQAWKAFLKTDRDYGIIFEEDVVLAPNFRDQFEKAIISVPTDYDILYLGCFGCQSRSNIWTYCMFYTSWLKPFKQINPHIVRPSVAMALHGYVVSRKGAAKLLELFDHNIWNHVDGMIQARTLLGSLTTYASCPRIAFQTSTDSIMVKSSNVSNQHPWILHKALSYIHFDEQVRFHYLMSFSVYQIFGIIITIMSLLMFLGGLLGAAYHVSLLWLTIGFLCLSLPDLLRPTWSILFHYFLVLVPTLFVRFISWLV
uniref:Glycosyl transferase family 25 domain-containing protein n=1 Tax=viral metagenome TaxID=1070528 RepID=A0A6C0DFW0_9ZZZZ